MARIDGVKPDEAEGYVKQVFDAQVKKWGAPLLNHLVYARRPTIFRGARGMWMGIDGSGLIDAGLQSLINRRVASINKSDEKILALHDYASSSLYNEVERIALEYADCMTITGREVTDELFTRLRAVYDDDAIVELTAIIAWENASSKFNRALRVPSQKLWKRDE